MEKLIYDILTKWCVNEMEQSNALNNHPEHFRASQALTQANNELWKAIRPIDHPAFLTYEAAQNRITCLHEEAAFLAGLRAGMRLIISL